ncbi:MAG: protein adenylyltransferase SelO family protein [Halobacteriovoraceae bacterium]|nr:protein adenylyltransferase SelO family protein [Halobacteriovoraceae bacterium]
MRILWLLPLLLFIGCSHLEGPLRINGRLPANEEIWNQVSDGKHSFNSLGNDFSVSLPMKRIDGAEVVLINERVAKLLGLMTEEDKKSFQEKILREFAYMVDPEGDLSTSEKVWFATRYQDSKDKGDGDARGDGRAAWSGEQIVGGNGEGKAKRHVDYVLKGTGQTPLAWTNHTQETHKDGLQGLKEAIHSFIISEANGGNQLDTTIDLAVIKLPIKRLSKDGEEVYTAITLRVGNQTRLAHLRYFTDNPSQFEKIFHYILRRDLAISSSEKITEEHVERYLKMFTENLAEEMARYYDLYVTHGSPTPGNRTTLGSSIDLSTMRYHEAFHGDYRYLGGMKMANQEEHLKTYVRSLFVYMAQAKYSYPATEANAKTMEKYFESQIDKNLEKLWLSRMGLSDSEIKRLPKSSKRRFIQFLKEMHQAQGKVPITYAGREMIPAAFDMREILSRAASVLQLPKEDQGRAWVELLKSDKKWFSLPNVEIEKWANSFQGHFEDLIEPLSQDQVNLKRWVKKARFQTPDKTQIRGQSRLKNKEDILLSDIVKNKGDVESWSKSANKLANELVDPNRPVRRFNNLITTDSCNQMMRNLF